MTPTLYIARSRNDNRIYPMTRDTLLRALKAEGSPLPQDDLAIINGGRGVRRGSYVFKKVDSPLDV